MKIEELGNKDYEYNREKGSYYVDNPLKALELKTWPDIMLAICAVPFLVAFGAMFVEKTKSFAVPITILFGGILCFALGGKVAYYRFRDSSIEGNINAWFSGWRHSFLADSLAVIGILLVMFGVYKIYCI